MLTDGRYPELLAGVRSVFSLPRHAGEDLEGCGPQNVCTTRWGVSPPNFNI
jgi:hypothetical protein